jgi:hypothetical protein
MVALNPFVAGPNVCKFCIVARRSVTRGIYIWCQKSSILAHSNTCPVIGGKVTSKMLLRDKAFVVTVFNHGGKAPEKVMRAEAAKIGCGGNAATDDVFWRVNKHIREQSNSWWDAKWAAMPQHLKRLYEEGNMWTDIKVRVPWSLVFKTIKVCNNTACRLAKMAFFSQRL